MKNPDAVPAYITRETEVQAPPEANAQLHLELHKLAELKFDKDRLEGELREQNKAIDMQQALCVAMMDKYGFKNCRTDTAQFIRSHQKRPHVLNEDALFADLEARGQSALIKRSVHHQSLVGLINEAEKEGLPPIDGVEVERIPIVQVRRAGSGAARSQG